MPSYEISSEERAALYCLHHDTHIVDRPDEPSNDGSVHATSRLTIVKAFNRTETFDKESEAYRRLARYFVRQIQCHMVPQLLRLDALLGVIEISVVKRPYVLDFGKIQLDRRLDEVWPAEVLDERWAYWESLFEPEQWPVVLAIWNELGNRFGIWLEDIHPGNIAFDT